LVKSENFEVTKKVPLVSEGSWYNIILSPLWHFWRALEGTHQHREDKDGSPANMARTLITSVTHAVGKLFDE
jgi:hypothetical protein